MYILLTAATLAEIKPTYGYLQEKGFKTNNHDIMPLVTGIGCMMTSYAITKAIHSRRPDYIIQAGVAGSFVPTLLPPQVVIIKDEMNGDLGVQEGELFRDLFDLGLMELSLSPYNKKRLENPLLENRTNYFNLPIVKGITVNEVSTDRKRIEALQLKYQAETESMEGAALHYIALMEQIPFLQLRAISNTVGERDKKNWQMQEAIKALNDTILNILPQL